MEGRDRWGVIQRRKAKERPSPFRTDIVLRLFPTPKSQQDKSCNSEGHRLRPQRNGRCAVGGFVEGISVQNKQKLIWLHIRPFGLSFLIL